MVDELLRNTNLPFIDWVTAFPLPERFKAQHIDKFSADEDPAEHIEAIGDYALC